MRFERQFFINFYLEGPKIGHQLSPVLFGKVCDFRFNLGQLHGVKSKSTLQSIKPWFVHPLAMVAIKKFCPQ
jgi:hypothetical protein